MSRNRMSTIRWLHVQPPTPPNQIRPNNLESHDTIVYHQLSIKTFRHRRYSTCSSTPQQLRHTKPNIIPVPTVNTHPKRYHTNRPLPVPSIPMRCTTVSTHHPQISIQTHARSALLVIERRLQTRLPLHPAEIQLFCFRS